ncbi:MAG: hypothetical protein JEY91_12190, partial [Spirochaetaceae bacterium]|nr:hypothetical protein [Spirochaetaceae bacterium]
MNIRSKIILITIPLIITPLIITLIVAILSARNGITVVATGFLTFKTEVLTNYMDNQWNLLADNDLEKDEKFISISKAAVESFAKTLIGSDSERIFAINKLGEITLKTGEIILEDNDINRLLKKIETRETGWQNLTINGKGIIADTSFFSPFGWYILVSVDRKAFYGEITNIILRTLLIFVISLILAVILL